MDVTIGIAFLAGLASFLSPCVFSLVPAYIGYLSGRSIAIAEGVEVKENRLITFFHGLAFVTGFSVVFIILGVTVSVLGGFLYDFSFWIAKIGGLVVVIFGLHMTGVIRIPFLAYDLRPSSSTDRKRSYFSSALMGIFFSAGWSPCVGPVLGAILTLALNRGRITEGTYLLTAYSAGLAIPFLLAALGIGWVTGLLKKFRRSMHYVEIVMGIILVIVGIMLFLGTFEQLARFGLFIDFGI